MEHHDAIEGTVASAEEAKKASINELLQRLSSSETGLSGSEAKQRLQQYGYNEIAEKRVSPILKLLSYFWGPIPWMIEVAAVLSGVVRHWADFSIIIVLLVFNAVVGFWQEYQAGNAVEALKKKLALKTRALRDGNWQEIALVWGYPISWAFLTDLAKLRVYRHLDMVIPRHQNFLRIVKQSLHHHAAHIHSGDLGKS